MLRILTAIGLYTCLSLAYAASAFYQVDLIVFTYRQSPLNTNNNTLVLPNAAGTKAIPLQSSTDNTIAPYHLKPFAQSQLNQEYWALAHKPEYQVLFRYSWLQPKNNQSAIVLPNISKEGWNVEGTLRVRQSNYYLIDTNLVFSAQNNSHSTFVFSQKQRLKPNTVYYLDHPNAGMIIKVHQIT